MKQHLITNEETKNFFNIIKENLSSCHEFKICVSFIRVSGAQLLVDILKELDEIDKNIVRFNLYKFDDGIIADKNAKIACNVVPKTLK